MKLELVSDSREPLSTALAAVTLGRGDGVGGGDSPVGLDSGSLEIALPVVRTVSSWTA